MIFIKRKVEIALVTRTYIARWFQCFERYAPIHVQVNCKTVYNLPLKRKRWCILCAWNQTIVFDFCSVLFHFLQWNNYCMERCVEIATHKPAPPNYTEAPFSRHLSRPIELMAGFCLKSANLQKRKIIKTGIWSNENECSYFK